jgi:large subunit ribosomal protein L10
MARPDKEAAVKDLSGRFSGSDAALLTEYRGLSVGEMAEVRRALRESGAEYRVSKNTLARIAVRDLGWDDLVTELIGPTAIAFVKGDAVDAAKTLDEAAKKFPVLQVKGGILDGKIISADQVRDLARLEPRDVQLAKIAMMMNHSAQQTVNALSALLRDLGSMLAQVVDQKGPVEVPADEPEATTDSQGPASGESDDSPPDQAAANDNEEE